MDKEKVSRLFRASEGYIKTYHVSDDTLEMLINDLQDLEREDWDITPVVIDVIHKARFDRSINMDPLEIFNQVQGIIEDAIIKDRDPNLPNYVIPFLKEPKKAKTPAFNALVFKDVASYEDACFFEKWRKHEISDQEFSDRFIVKNSKISSKTA